MHLLPVTFACDNACAFCAQASLRAATVSAELRARAAELPAGEAVVIVGGEPLLFPGLVDLVKHLAGSRPVGLQTNARRLAETTLASELARAGLLWVEVALQGDHAELHDYHTQTPGSFLGTVAGAAKARAAGLELRLTTVVTRSNYRHLPALVGRAIGLGATRQRFAAVAPEGDAVAVADRLVPAPALVRPFLVAARRRAESSGLQVELGSVEDTGFAGLGCVPSLTPEGWTLHPAARTRSGASVDQGSVAAA